MWIVLGLGFIEEQSMCVSFALLPQKYSDGFKGSEKSGVLDGSIQDLTVLSQAW